MIMFEVNFSLLTLSDSTIASLSTSVFILCYLCFCTYFGLFNLKFSSYYAFHKDGQTDAYSLLYSANILTRLAAPLCFNFLKLTNVSGTQFHKTLGLQDAIPLIGSAF
mmetsp:Transcript_19841/g.14278  ORF Transcript_19841/g.14278 Transcript_19841/m.14278 type:complete len:108 (-) Transcript_19841:407-730(-)